MIKWKDKVEKVMGATTLIITTQSVMIMTPSIAMNTISTTLCCV